MHIVYENLGFFSSKYITLCQCVSFRFDYHKQVQRARGEYHHEFAFGYRGILHGLKSVFAQDGFVGLFKGVGARMLFHAPSTALSIGFYEYFRAAITQTS